MLQTLDAGVNLILVWLSQTYEMSVEKIDSKLYRWKQTHLVVQNNVKKLTKTNITRDLIPLSLAIIQKLAKSEKSSSKIEDDKKRKNSLLFC